MLDDMKIDPERIYTIGAAAQLLNVSPSTLRDLERRGHVACSRTPGRRQRQFAGSELLRLQDEANRVPSRETRPTPSTGAVVTEDVKVRQAWLGSLIARAQRELPADTPAEVRLRLGADLARALRNVGPASPLADVEAVVKRQIEQANHQVQEAQEEAQRREIKDQMLEYGQAYLGRSIKDLPRRIVGAPDSLKRRHVRATLRDQLHDRLQKRLKGNEDWNHVRDLVDELLAAWYVGRLPACASRTR
jgi:MerR family regulatory protein